WHRESKDENTAPAEQRVRPELPCRIAPWHRVIVARLPAPADFAAEYEAGEEHRVAEPHDRREQEKEDRFGDRAGDKTCSATEHVTQLRPQYDIEHGRDFRREPHDERDDEQRHPGVGPDEV